MLAPACSEPTLQGAGAGAGSHAKPVMVDCLTYEVGYCGMQGWSVMPCAKLSKQGHCVKQQGLLTRYEKVLQVWDMQPQMAIKPYGETAGWTVGRHISAWFSSSILGYRRVLPAKTNHKGAGCILLQNSADRRRVKRKCAILEQVTGCKNHYPAHWAWVAYGGKHALRLLIDVLRRAKEQQLDLEWEHLCGEPDCIERTHLAPALASDNNSNRKTNCRSQVEVLLGDVVRAEARKLGQPATCSSCTDNCRCQLCQVAINLCNCMPGKRQLRCVWTRAGQTPDAVEKAGSWEGEGRLPTGTPDAALRAHMKAAADAVLERVQFHQEMEVTGEAGTAGTTTVTVQQGCCSSQASFAGGPEQQPAHGLQEQQRRQQRQREQQQRTPARLAMRRWSKHPRSVAVMVAKTPCEGATQASRADGCHAHELAGAPAAKRQRVAVAEAAIGAEVPATWLGELPGLVERCLGLLGRYLPFYNHIGMLGSCKVA